MKIYKYVVIFLTLLRAGECKVGFCVRETDNLTTICKPIV
jgi:hypothetical protein